MFDPIIIFLFLKDIISNVITYSPFGPYYVTRTSANGSAVYWSQWSRDFRLYHVTTILHCHCSCEVIRNIPYTLFYMNRLTPGILRFHPIIPFSFPVQSL